MWTPIFSASVESLAFVGRFLPFGRRARRAARLVPNLSYADATSARPSDCAPRSAHAHRFDLWLPEEGRGPWPLVMYVHGGGFVLGSKESHWWMAANLAAQGFCVANINYRLAPDAKHPAALQDVAAAWRYIGEHAATYGADPARAALMGESAGANLVLALALALSAKEPPEWLGAVPPVTLRAVLPAAGLLDVARPERFEATKPRVHPAVLARIRNVCRQVLPDGATGHEDALRWASPLRLLEADLVTKNLMERRLGGPLPAMAIGVGANDPILDDSQRLARALLQTGTSYQLDVYPNSGHAFFAWPPHAQTQAFWRATAAFLHAQLAGAPSESQRQVAASPTA